MSYQLTENEVAEEIAGSSSVNRDQLRRLAQEDLFVMAKGVLGYPDVNRGTHKAYCDFMVSAPFKRRLGLMPRSHLKSTIGTIADAIRIVVKNPEHERILIASETATQAEAFLRELKGHWIGGKVLRQLFPELIPERFSGQGIDWSSTRASVNRAAPHKEGHWMTIGVGGAITGFHFTRIKCDDLIGLEASRSPAKMKDTIAWNNGIEPLLVDQNTDIIDWTGTRWGRADLYADIMNSYRERLGVFSRQAIENGVIIFPQKHNWEEYEFLQTRRPGVWYAQYCNNPQAGGKNDFPVEKVGFFRFGVDFSEVIFTKDGVEKRWRFDQLDRVITCDPNSGSRTAENFATICVSAISPDDEVFVLEILASLYSPSELVDEIYRLAERWRPRVIGIEKAGQQNTDHYMKLKMEKERMYFNVQPLTPKNQHKEDRVRYYLEPIIRGGQLYTLPSHTALREQIATFPDCLLWDELDALAYGPEVWKRPMRTEDIESAHKILSISMKRRSRVTGY